MNMPQKKKQNKKKLTMLWYRAQQCTHPRVILDPPDESLWAALNLTNIFLAATAGPGN
jgi:hypothetical protein